jgi:hypothetical protein
MKRRLLGTVAAGCVTLGMFAATAGADPGNSQGNGPGECVVPGTVFNQTAQQPGSNAGPNSAFPWAAFNPAGTPNAPGQEVKYECTPNVP